MTEELHEIAKLIDHAVLHPTQTKSSVLEASVVALKYKVASLCVKPCHVAYTKELLQGSEVVVSTVIGFPHGGQTVTTKLAESQKAIEEGATELDMVVNISKVLEEDYDYVFHEISEINNYALKNDAIVKVIFETDYLKRDHIIRLCECCNRAKVSFVKTSTGFGYTKRATGDYNYTGATEEDVILMKTHVTNDIGVKASGGIRNLKDLLKFKDLGATRIGTSSTTQILEEIN